MSICYGRGKMKYLKVIIIIILTVFIGPTFGFTSIVNNTDRAGISPRLLEEL
jgi:hypothetical protein